MEAGVPPTGRFGVVQAVDELDIGALGRAVWRKKLSIGALTLTAAGLAFIAVNLITPRYKSEARVLIETRENIFLRPDAEKSTERGSLVDQETVISQVQLVLSRDLARDIIKKLKLGERAEFDPVLRGLSPIRALLVHFGIIKDPMTQALEERVLKSYFDRLVAFTVDKSRVIAIEFEAENPELAAQAANAIAEAYILRQQAAKQEQSRAAGQWLSGEIENLRNRVADAESRVEQYRASTNLFVGTNNTTLSSQQLGEFNAQLSAARAHKADIEAKARIIRDSLRSGGPIEFSDITNSELIRRLSEHRVTLQGQLAEQSSTLLDQHPRIKELRAQIADLDRQLRVEADRLARSLENDAKMADARVSSLSAGLDQLKRLAANTNEQEVQLRALERDAKSQRDLLESYLGKYREATARDSIDAASPEARIISRALVSTTPAYPKTLATVLVAALGMFAVSVGWVFSGELLGAIPGPTTTAPWAPPLRRAPPAASAGPIAASASLARRESSAQGPLADRPPENSTDSSAAAGIPPELIEGLARELGAAGPQGRRIAILGVRRNLPNSQAAVALARRLAKESRVVLVDIGGGSSHVLEMGSDPHAPGISELVSGAASFAEIITRDRYSRAHIITAGAAAGDGSAILRFPRLPVTLEALARSYDQVVMNAGALPEIPVERLAQFARWAVLVADAPDDPVTASMRERLCAAGFANVSVLASAPRGPQSDARRTRAAA